MTILTRPEGSEGSLAVEILHGPRPTAGRWCTAGRLTLGAFFLAMAGYNVLVVLPDAAETYRETASISWPGVDRLMLDLVVPAATLWALALVCFEVAVAALVLWRGRAVRVGLLAAVVFMIGLTPIVSWYVLANVPLVIGALLLLSRDHDRSVLELGRRHAE